MGESRCGAWCTVLFSVHWLWATRPYLIAGRWAYCRHAHIGSSKNSQITTPARAVVCVLHPRSSNRSIDILLPWRVEISPRHHAGYTLTIFGHTRPTILVLLGSNLDRSLYWSYVPHLATFPLWLSQRRWPHLNCWIVHQLFLNACSPWLLQSLD